MEVNPEGFPKAPIPQEAPVRSPSYARPEHLRVIDVLPSPFPVVSHELLPSHQAARDRFAAASMRQGEARLVVIESIRDLEGADTAPLAVDVIARARSIRPDLSEELIDALYEDLRGVAVEIRASRVYVGTHLTSTGSNHAA